MEDPKQKEPVGFIGQGWIGRHYADDYENRGFATVRYSLEEPYRDNKDRITECPITFIAVPTPTTPDGFDDSIVRDALSIIAPGNIAVLKSTILPGTTATLQAQFPDIIVLYSPEFLSEATAAHDAAHPFSNIVGMSIDNDIQRNAAARVHAILAPAAYTATCTSLQAELIKYSHNGSGYVEILFFNLMYDLSQRLGAEWQPIQDALQADPYIAHRYAKPVHKSGRGAGGHCFIKDFAALRELYEKTLPEDSNASVLMRAAEKKNHQLLTESGKDVDLLEGVYGKGHA